MSEFTKNRIVVYNNTGTQSQGYVDSVNGLKVRVQPQAGTGERYTISSTSNGISTLSSTNDGDDRFPTGVECFRLATRIEDLTTAGVTWPTDAGCYPFRVGG